MASTCTVSRKKFTFAISSPYEFLLIFGELLYRPLFTVEGQIWCARADPRSNLQAKFHLNVFIVSASGGQNHNFWQILTFLWAPVPTPFYRWGPNLVCYSRPTVHPYVPNFVSIGLFCRPQMAKNPIFVPFFWISAFSGVDSWRQSEKVKHGCTTTNIH